MVRLVALSRRQAWALMFLRPRGVLAPSRAPWRVSTPTHVFPYSPLRPFATTLHREPRISVKCAERACERSGPLWRHGRPRPPKMQPRSGA